MPGVEEIAEQLLCPRTVVGPQRLWVNPDCGLKTRSCAETAASLRVSGPSAGRKAVPP